MNFNDNEESIKVKGKIYAITTLSVIGVIVLFIFTTILSVIKLFDNYDKHKYYVTKINNNNKEDIKTLLENENFKYCESIYKIEYEQVLTGAIFAKVYCKDENNIFLNIYDNESKLIQYIRKNSYIEKR